VSTHDQESHEDPDGEDPDGDGDQCLGGPDVSPGLPDRPRGAPSEMLSLGHGFSEKASCGEASTISKIGGLDASAAHLT
jgi:hypothetical protein